MHIKKHLNDVMLHCRECSVSNGGSPKEPNYVHGYPKPPQLSPVVRNNHLHFGNEVAGKLFSILYTKVIKGCRVKSKSQIPTHNFLRVRFQRCD